MHSETPGTSNACDDTFEKTIIHQDLLLGCEFLALREKYPWWLNPVHTRQQKTGNLPESCTLLLIWIDTRNDSAVSFIFFPGNSVSIPCTPAWRGTMIMCGYTKPI